MSTQRRWGSTNEDGEHPSRIQRRRGSTSEDGELPARTGSHQRGRGPLNDDREHSNA